MLVGGEKLRRRPHDGLPFRVADNYGPTEITVLSTMQWLEAETPPACIGSPIDNHQLYVCDERGQLLPRGVPGDLFIGGTGVALGYQDRPRLTATCFVPDPFGGRPGTRLYRSGDRVRMFPAGALQFLGRRDGQVKIRGLRIELGEIDMALVAHPQINAAVCVTHLTTTAGENLWWLTWRAKPYPSRACCGPGYKNVYPLT